MMKSKTFDYSGDREHLRFSKRAHRFARAVHGLPHARDLERLPFLAILGAHFGKRLDLAVADMLCGTGYLIEALLPFSKQAIGADFSREMLKEGQIGNKIDFLFLDVIESIIKAGYSDKLEKEIFLKRASVKMDLLKFFLQVAWEIKSLDNKKYINISEKLNEIGKMLGGWIRSIK